MGLGQYEIYRALIMLYGFVTVDGRSVGTVEANLMQDAPELEAYEPSGTHAAEAPTSQLRLGHKHGFHQGDTGHHEHHATRLGHQKGFYTKDHEEAGKDLRLGHKHGFHHVSGQAEAIKDDDLKAFIVHHTGGRGTVEGVQETLRQRHLGVEYVMDREGNIVKTGERGAAHMLPGWGPKGAGLSNKNVLGMEVIAKDDKDVTPAQVAAAKAFINKNYPNLPVYGHGEVNPGHKEADEGMTIVNAIRNQRNGTSPPVSPTPGGKQVKGSWFDDASTATGLSAATTPGIALPSREGLGKMHEITGPNGQTVRLPQIDVGPAAWTGRGIDISKGALEKFGYTPKNFPANAPFTHKPVGPQSSIDTPYKTATNITPPVYDDERKPWMDAPNPKTTPPTGAEKKEPPSGIYPPTPGDNQEYPKGWNIPSDYDLG